MLMKFSRAALSSATLLFCVASLFAQTEEVSAENPVTNPVYTQPAQPSQPAQPQQYYGTTQSYSQPPSNNVIYINQSSTQPPQNNNQPQQNYNQGYPQQGNNQAYANQGYGQPQQQQYGQPPQNYYQPQGTYAPVPPENPPSGKTSLQTLNFALPIERETWDFDDLADAEWSSLGFQFSWTNYKFNKNGYSSLFGITLGYISGETEMYNLEMNGLDFNLKFGWGVAPVADNLTIAMHVLMGVDFKAVEGDIETRNTTRRSDDYDYSGSSPKDLELSATYFDLMIGGDFIIGYKLTESFGLVAGVDVTTNIFGFGFVSLDGPYEDSWAIDYIFSGINIVPHVGIAFIF